MPTSYSHKGDHQRSTTPIGALSRFARKQEAAPPVVEHCELCNTPIPAQHRHLLVLPDYTIACSCNACSLLFGRDTAGGGKYRIIPSLYRILPDFQMLDAQWDDLMIPVNMAYIFYNSVAGRVVAFYPSPAGAMESLLSLESWQVLVENNPILNELQPDVEALLVNRLRDAHEYAIVPIDACYQLVGLIRMLWRGLSGGEAVWNAIDSFFADIQAKSSLQEAR